MRQLVRGLRNIYYNSTFLNAFRRAWHTLDIVLSPRSINDVKIHLGCGNQKLPGYVNVDWRKTSATDRVLDIRHLVYPSNSVAQIECYHVIEHFSHTEIERILSNWLRVLAPGGKLVIECPDFDAVCQAYLDNRDSILQLYYIFGRQRFPGDTHLFGFNFARLFKLLDLIGFTDIHQTEPQDYHKNEAACMRVECLKPRKFSSPI
jgi:SAM-dependent methyltransferase